MSVVPVLLLVLLVGCGAGHAWACPIPVFRYALEKGPSDLYSVSVVHSGRLPGEDQTLLARLNQPGVQTVELTDLSAPTPESVGEGVTSPTVPPIMPWLVLRHQRNTNEAAQVTWQGPFNRETVDQLLNAPDRAEIARRLLSGDSAVWLVFPGTNEAENAAVTDRLTRVLTAAEKELVLPKATLAPGRPVGRGSSPAALETGGTPVPREERGAAGMPSRLPEPSGEGPAGASSIPLKLRFSVLILAPGTPGSELLKKMLLPLAPDLEALRSPAVVPVYGCGHALTVVTGKDLAAPHLRNICEFLIGHCSCLYKARNPGVDLFFALDWQAKVADRPEAAKGQKN